MNLGPPSHLVVAASGWVGRAVGALAQIVMINLVITHIGTVDYAIFAILYGLVGWFQVADFGLGVSLQNFISESRAKGLPHAQAVRAISTLTLILFSVQALLLALSAGWIGPWLLRQFAIPDVSKSHLFLVCSVLLLTFSLGQVATRIYYAEKRGYVTNLVFAGAQTLGCLLAWGSMRLGQTPPLPWALGAFLLPSALVMTGLFIGILSRKAPGPSLSPEQIRLILRRAVGFAGFSLSAAFVLQIDVVIISQFLGPQEIASYTLLSKILAFVFVMYSEALLALWPMVTERLAVRDASGIRKWVYLYLASGASLMIAACLALLWRGDWFLEILAPRSGIHATLPLLCLFGVYYLVRVWCDTFAMLLQSISKLVHLWVAVPIQGALSLGLQWTLAPKFGIAGVLVALTLSFLLTVAWVLPFALNREMSRMAVRPS